ncbi:HNH endonuclease [Pseudohoeflea suaedae]|uniref:HNH endonuclease n=1 Tax=Pseudohoeflea suaedae TaxID=877384 RepID=A0A4R5PK95_9HYPH|nr:HNH endonuclease [Pseudohoeflea suaedae]
MKHPSAEWKHLYDTAKWKRLRKAQLSLFPLCEWCLEREEVTEATEVHHKVPHKGDLDLFWGGPFVSTCKPCHSSRGKLEDHGKTVVRFDVDGWPI